MVNQVDFSKSAKAISGLYNAFGGVIMAAGVLVIAIGIYEIVLAFGPDSNTNQKIKAISTMIAGIILVMFPTIMNIILAGTGVQLSNVTGW